MQLKKVAAVAVFLASGWVGVSYFMGASNDSRSQEDLVTRANGPVDPSPLAQLSNAPVSDERNFETQGAATADLEKSGRASNDRRSEQELVARSNGAIDPLPLANLNAAPVSDKVNVHTQAAAIADFKKSGSKIATHQYLADLREVVLQGKGANYLLVFATYYPRFGMTRDERDTFLASLPAPSNPQLKAIIKGWQNELKLRTTPFQFGAPTMEGDYFDLGELRGKVVLVDHWDTVCSACIEAMPRIASAHKKYKDKGFEVVSVVYPDPLGNLDNQAIKRIEREVGAMWPTLNGAGQWDKLATTYGYAGKPQYMLLDRKGRLIAGTGEVDLGRNLEALLEEHL